MSLFANLDGQPAPATPIAANSSVSLVTQNWAEHLQCQFSDYRTRNPQGQCWLLLDPSIYNPNEVLGIGSSLSQVIHPIRWRHRNLVPEHRPYLVPLELNRLHGSALLNTSLQQSAMNWQPESIIQGFGHSVCGWLFSDADGMRLSEHLGGLAVQPQHGISSSAPAKRMLLRYWDPSVIPSLWNVLDTRQKQIFLGPLHAWHLIDRFNQMQVLQMQDNQATPKMTEVFLDLLEIQWMAIQNISAINAALIESLAQEKGLNISEPLLKAANRTLIRGRRAGIHDTQDLAVFARHALQIHPEFDSHSLVQSALRRISECRFYSAAVSNFTDDDWQTVRQHCLAKHAPSLNTESDKTP